MKKPAPNFIHKKAVLIFYMLGIGMAIALAWSFWASVILNEGYPESYVVAFPFGRFSDFTDETKASLLPNPYSDPYSFYSPATFVLFRILSHSDVISLICVYFFSLTALAFLLVQVLKPVAAGSWPRVSLAFLFLFLSYPLIYCIDRGNIEILMLPFIAWAIYFYHRHEDLKGTACLFPAICLKFYPALLLIPLLRRKKIGLIAICGVLSVIAIVSGSFFFESPVSEIWSHYRKDLNFYRDSYLLNIGSLEGAASPWNAYKVGLIGLQDLHLIPKVNFGFDGPLILTSYKIYSIAIGLLTITCAVYAWLYERQALRGTLMILLLLSIAAPSGGDYRLMYASLGLVVLMLLPRKRRGDWIALILVTLAVIPKKEIMLTCAGRTETGFSDVAIQVLLNPVFVLAAMGILLYESRRAFDWEKVWKAPIRLLFSRWRFV